MVPCKLAHSLVEQRPVRGRALRDADRSARIFFSSTRIVFPEFSICLACFAFLAFAVLRHRGLPRDVLLLRIWSSRDCRILQAGENVWRCEIICSPDSRVCVRNEHVDLF